jgi:hypothetical protein
MTEIFTAAKIHIVVFWVMASCSNVVGFQRFGEPCCPCLQVNNLSHEIQHPVALSVKCTSFISLTTLFVSHFLQNCI